MTTTNKWKATHEVTQRLGRKSYRTKVMLVGDGAAYSRGEWTYSDKAIFEVVDGKWLSQGQPFTGKVREIGGAR
jgi:hypothetical protein